MSEPAKRPPAAYTSPGPQTTPFEVLGRTAPALSFYGVLARVGRWLERSGRSLVISLPFLWLGVFFLAPFLIVLKLSLSESVLAVPPYAPLIDWVDDGGLSYLNIRLNLSNYLLLFEDRLYLIAFLNSLRIAAIATLLTLCVALPFANAMSRVPERWRALLLMLVILPFWTSFLIRVYAWIGILKPEGILNAVLMGLGVISEPLTILNTEIAVYIGIVYSYLPFMVLPIYASLEKMDPSLIEAAVDLGSPPIKAFWTITVRIALPGIIAGCLLVFIPAAGEFVIPDLLGGSETLMIGRTLWLEFFNNRDWPLASAVAIVLLAALTVPIVLFQRHQARRGGEDGAA